MTNEQINIAIAEACGWNPPPEAMGNMTHGGGKFFSSEEWREAHIPNYGNDLNAIHEAEKILNKKQQNDYCFTLMDIQNSWGGFERLHATAKQRAEAFLRTLEKWEETK